MALRRVEEDEDLVRRLIVNRRHRVKVSHVVDQRHVLIANTYPQQSSLFQYDKCISESGSFPTLDIMGPKAVEEERRALERLSDNNLGAKLLLEVIASTNRSRGSRRTHKGRTIQRRIRFLSI